MAKQKSAVCAVLCVGALCAVSGVRAGSWNEVETYSDIRKSIDLGKLAKGDIPGERIQVPSTPLGISVQTCYLVGAAPTAVLARMRDDQSSDKVKASDTLDKKGTFKISAPVQAADFTPLSLDPGMRSAKSVLGNALEADAKKGKLNLSPEEA